MPSSYYKYCTCVWSIYFLFLKRPSAAEGHTRFIATGRGHLLPGVRTKVCFDDLHDLHEI